MGKRIAVYAGLAGVLLGWLVVLAGCASTSDEAAAPATSPPSEVVVETESVAEPNVPEKPAEDAVVVQVVEEKDAPPVETEPGQPVALTLTYVPGQTTTYKVTTEIERSIAWEGDTTNKPATFRDGRNGRRTEVTFEQTVAQVSSTGSAALDVTIKAALSYMGRARDEVVLDFDSSRAADQQHPLAGLIGQRYRVEVTPRGAVLALVDADAARQAAQGNGTALRLLSDKAIERRHAIPALMALDAPLVAPGEHWNSIRAISFGTLGSKAYDRIYTLQGFEPSDGGRIAIVEMEAIPPVVGAGQALPELPANPFAAMSDNTDSYTGQLQLDLDAGQVRRYVEQFRTEWITADPGSLESGQGSPAVLKMGMHESYQLERIE